MTQEQVEFVFELEEAEPQLEAELTSAFPDALISPANNFFGSLTIAVLLKPAVDALESVLTFVTNWRDRYKNASITINKQKIVLEGYKPGDAIKILRSAGFALPEEEGAA